MTPADAQTTPRYFSSEPAALDRDDDSELTGDYNIDRKRWRAKLSEARKEYAAEVAQRKQDETKKKLEEALAAKRAKAARMAAKLERSVESAKRQAARQQAAHEAFEAKRAYTDSVREARENKAHARRAAMVLYLEDQAKSWLSPERIDQELNADFLEETGKILGLCHERSPYWGYVAQVERPDGLTGIVYDDDDEKLTHAEGGFVLWDPKKDLARTPRHRDTGEELTFAEAAETVREADANANAPSKDQGALAAEEDDAEEAAGSAREAEESGGAAAAGAVSAAGEGEGGSQGGAGGEPPQPQQPQQPQKKTSAEAKAAAKAARRLEAMDKATGFLRHQSGSYREYKELRESSESLEDFLDAVILQGELQDQFDEDAYTGLGSGPFGGGGGAFGNFGRGPGSFGGRGLVGGGLRSSMPSVPAADEKDKLKIEEQLARLRARRQRPAPPANDEPAAPPTSPSSA